METPHDPHDLRKQPRRTGAKALCFLFLALFLLLPSSLQAQETVEGEGKHNGLLISHTKQTIKIGPVKPGQTLQVVCSAQWSAEKDGRVDWILEDANEMKLRTASHTNPEGSFIALEWTSNSEPRPESYSMQIQTSGGSAGQELGEYTLLILLRDQNDGDSGTDAPESFEKALLLPAQEPGTYGFGECFLSGTADLYDLYKIELRPNYSLNFKALPLQWKGSPKGRVTWEFLNKSYKAIKKGQSSPGQSVPFGLRILHPRVRSETKPGIYYLLVKIEGDVSLFYSLHLEIKEGP